MDIQQIPSTEFAPVLPPVTQRPVEPPHQKQKLWIYFFAVIVLVFFLYTVFGMIRASINREPEQITAPTPTPSAIVTPTSAPLSQIAQQNAFIDFSSAVATLSAAITAFTADDPTLAPPTLILPLGFAK